MDILGTDTAQYNDHNSGFFTHVTHRWITNAGIRDAILELIEYPTLYHLILLLENDDVVNSIKNRRDRYSLQIDKTIKQVLAIPSFIRHIQNNTCTISSGIADITNYFVNDLIKFTKTHHSKVDYDFDAALSSGIRHNMTSEDDEREISYRSNHVRQFRDSIGYQFWDFPELKGASAEAFATYDLELRTWCSILGLDGILRTRDEHTYDVEKSQQSKLVLAHNKFMYGVFYHTMTTVKVKAREIILKHLKNLDGNGVYNDMKVHYEDVNSVIRIQQQQNLISSLHSTVPSEYSAYNISDLISQWMTNYNRYIAMNNPPLHNKLLILEHHIGNIKELRDVSTMYGMLSVSNSPYRSSNDDDIIKLYYRQVLLLADTLRKSLIIGRRKQFVHELRNIDDTWYEDGYTRINMNMASLVDTSISDGLNICAR